MTNTTELTNEERVEKGAALLDEQNPGWYKRINLDTLDQCDPSLCILGQLYGAWYTGNRILSDFAENNDLDYSYGFDGSNNDTMTKVWTAFITKRRKQAEANLHEAAARNQKAGLMAGFIVAVAAEGGYLSQVSGGLVNLSDESWAEMADVLGINPPNSEETKDAVRVYVSQIVAGLAEAKRRSPKVRIGKGG